MSEASLVVVERVSKRFLPPPAPWRALTRRPTMPAITALHDVNLDVRPGEVLGLVGENGAGKTVLLKLIATLTEPTQGRVRVFGLDTTTHARTIRARVGLATCDERSFYWRLSAQQNLQFFAQLYAMPTRVARARVQELLATVELTDLADRAYRTLSAGNRQRLALARALLADPDLLLLDEPTRSLDPAAASHLRALVAERVRADRRRAVVFTTHDLAEVDELCARVAVLRQGHCVWAGAVAELRRRFGAGDEVTLRVRGLTEPALAELRARTPGLLHRQDGHDAVVLRLSLTQADAGALAGVVSSVVRAGGEVVGCHTARRPLHEVCSALVASPVASPAAGSGGERA